MSMLFTQFGEAAPASGPAALGISGQAFIIQLLTFLIVFLILKKFAFGPIIKLLRERRDLIESGVSLGEKMRAEEAAAEAKAAATLKAARQKADGIVADAETEARGRVQAAEDQARARADGIIKEAESQIKQAASRERKRLEKEIVGMVSEVSEAVIREKVSPEKDAKLIDEALKEYRAA